MDPQPIRNERILEAIEACRPGSDDANDPALRYLAAALAADPELKALYERLQQIDAELAEAFQDVATPDGLQDRLLERLAAARQQEVTATASTETVTAVSPRPKRVSRRWVLAAGGALSAAAVMLIALWMGRPDEYSEDDLLEGAIDFFADELNHPTDPGQLLTEKQPPDYPFSRFVASRGSKVRWRAIRGFLGRGGVAYDMSRRGTRATLYVVSRPITGLPPEPSRSRPAHTTGGYSTSVWSEKGRMYVLVVHGGAETYPGFFVRRRGYV